MRRAAIGFGSGLIFGLGLVISGMVDPQRVLGFLDIAGTWDPTLAFVMGGALAVTFVGYRWVMKRQAPLAAERFTLPERTDIDPRLIVGAALFGAGWGLGGYCPGPALTALTVGGWPTLVFVLSMFAGMLLARRVPEGFPIGRSVRA
jgi:uncharacterized membrane protein YedE/YeeE